MHAHDTDEDLVDVDPHDPGDVSLPVFRWRQAGPGLATRRQLREMGLRPGGQEPVARIECRGGRRFAWLYRIDLARPKFPMTLAKEAARAEGAKEAWFVDEQGYVTEGASSNAWIVDRNGKLITRQVDNVILRGITRTTLIDLLRRENLELVERPFTVAEAQAAREAFITSATNFVMPVVRIDDKPIGNGAPGLLSLKLRAEYHSAAEIGDA